MKLFPPSPNPLRLPPDHRDCSPAPRRRRRREEGVVAVFVMLALLGIMLVCVAANLRSLSSLKKELKLTEQHQIRRLNTANGTPALPRAAETNVPSASASAPATP